MLPTIRRDEGADSRNVRVDSRNTPRGCNIPLAKENFGRQDSLDPKGRERIQGGGGVGAGEIEINVGPNKQHHHNREKQEKKPNPPVPSRGLAGGTQ